MKNTKPAVKGITQDQFYAIIDLVAKIQEQCEDADTSSVNTWLSCVNIDSE